MDWIIKKFEDFSTEGLYDVLKLRTAVFIVEQECAYLELDGRDKFAVHMMAKENDKLAAYLRILPKDLAYKEVSIGRVIVSENWRGKGLARELLQRAITFVQKNWQEKAIKIEAQYYLRDFYKSFNFQIVSDPFFEDGIKHVEMLLEI